MPKTRKKSDFPSKICATCGRPFDWRRKWAKVWDEVRYCSDACRARRGKAATGGKDQPGS
ncbi:DUF2256 domain-containing protein [Tropicibacter oceani]|uniref:DUF2256 domain-containing protein n=1 Tax=Tropicibacter oceani TaxID=3058420 RepID=A0ABY8QH00_9RHOB|nr:DUF2256 domain-containing protein [Tropicibacter oceani]WGW03273.1 DUF2256 domain-containing protein [Tropicibacter oceani]